MTHRPLPKHPMPPCPCAYASPAQSFIMGLLLVQVFKVMVGRLRPNFLVRCAPWPGPCWRGTHATRRCCCSADRLQTSLLALLAPAAAAAVAAAAAAAAAGHACPRRYAAPLVHPTLRFTLPSPCARFPLGRTQVPARGASQRGFLSSKRHRVHDTRRAVPMRRPRGHGEGREAGLPLGSASWWRLARGGGGCRGAGPAQPAAQPGHGGCLFFHPSFIPPHPLSHLPPQATPPLPSTWRSMPRAT